jgi:putative PIN family toxin of toxin-antitoxin system
VIPKVVLDTNIYISAIRYGGKPKVVLDSVLGGQHRLLISPILKAELERVLRDKFSYSAHEIAATGGFLWQHALWVNPTTHVNLCPDEPDNRVLECAIDGNADYLVTGDRHLLDLPPIAGLIILPPGAFLLQFPYAHGLQ